MLKCDFNKAALQLYSNCISAWVFSYNFLHFFRTPFRNNPSGGMLLKIENRLVMKPKIIESLSVCKNHSISLDSSNDF